MAGFAARLSQIIAEFGSRYALAKASGIPATTLQKYALGSKPGMDSLVVLARVANVDLNWLLTGQGPMRGAGQLPGATLADDSPAKGNQIPPHRRNARGHFAELMLS